MEMAPLALDKLDFSDGNDAAEPSDVSRPAEPAKGEGGSKSGRPNPLKVPIRKKESKEIQEIPF
jgi:hypothetical protein